MRVHRYSSVILVPPYTAYFILYLGRQNNSEDFPGYKFLPFKIYVQEESKEVFQHYEIKFDEQTKDIVRQYTEAVVFFALVKFNDELNKYEWSETETLEVLL